MKEIISFISVFLLLLWVAMQPVVNQINHARMALVENIVHKAAQEARADGCFTQENIAGITDDITNAFPSISPTEIEMTLTTTPKYRTNQFDDREMISFSVSVPIDKILAMPSFFGITDAQNSMNYTVAGQVPSERLP